MKLIKIKYIFLVFTALIAYVISTNSDSNSKLVNNRRIKQDYGLINLFYSFNLYKLSFDKTGQITSGTKKHRLFQIIPQTSQNPTTPSYQGFRTTIQSIKNVRQVKSDYTSDSKFDANLFVDTSDSALKNVIGSFSLDMKMNSSTNTQVKRYTSFFYSQIAKYEVDYTNLVFEEKFLEDLKNYSDNRNDDMIKKNFFNKYGTHFVISADFGGIRTYSSTSDKTDEKSENDIQAKLDKYAKGGYHANSQIIKEDSTIEFSEIGNFESNQNKDDKVVEGLVIHYTMGFIAELVPYLPETIFIKNDKDNFRSILLKDSKDYLSLKNIRSKENVITDVFFTYSKARYEGKYKNCVDNEPYKGTQLKDKVSGQSYPGYYTGNYNSVDLRKGSTGEFAAVCYTVTRLSEATSYVAEIDVAKVGESCDQKINKYQGKEVQVTIAELGTNINYKLCVYKVIFNKNIDRKLKTSEKRNQLSGQKYLTSILAVYDHCPTEIIVSNHKCLCNPRDVNYASFNGDKSDGVIGFLGVGSSPFYLCPGTNVYSASEVFKKLKK